MNHQPCKPQDLQLQIAVCQLYKPRLDGRPGIRIAAEVFYPENVNGYFCENCERFFGVERESDAAATEEGIQQAWQRALRHLREAAYEERDTAGALTEAMPLKEPAGAKGALLASLPVVGTPEARGE